MKRGGVKGSIRGVEIGLRGFPYFRDLLACGCGASHDEQEVSVGAVWFRGG